MKRARTLVVLALLSSGACRDTAAPPVVSGLTLADSADQVAFGMTTWIHDRGLQRAMILADTAYFLNEQTKLDMRSVSARFYTSTGAEEGQMTALLAVYDTRTEIMEGWGDVVLRSTDGRKLETSQLRYDKTTNLITTDSAFTLTEPDRVVRGVGFKSDPGMTSYEIKRLLSGSVGRVAVPNR